MTGIERLNRLTDQRWQLLPSLLTRHLTKPGNRHAQNLREALSYLQQDKRLSTGARHTIANWQDPNSFERLALRTAQWIERYGYAMPDARTGWRNTSPAANSEYRQAWLIWLSFMRKIVAARSSFDLFKAATRLGQSMTQYHAALDALFAQPLSEAGGPPDRGGSATGNDTPQRSLQRKTAPGTSSTHRVFLPLEQMCPEAEQKVAEALTNVAFDRPH